MADDKMTAQDISRPDDEQEPGQIPAPATPTPEPPAQRGSIPAPATPTADQLLDRKRRAQAKLPPAPQSTPVPKPPAVPRPAPPLSEIETRLEAETGHDVVQTGKNPPTFAETGKPAPKGKKGS